MKRMPISPAAAIRLHAAACLQCLLLILALMLAVLPLRAAQDTSPNAPVRPEQTTGTPATDQLTQLAADSAQILELARQLKVDVDKSNKNQLSLAVVKNAGKIEKLAHSARERFKQDAAKHH